MTYPVQHGLLRALLAVVLVAAVVGSAWGDTLRLPGLAGGELTEAELAEGRVIVVVWASWSPRGRDIGARAQRIAERWGRQARVVAVNFQEERGEVEAFVREHPFGVPVFLDPEGELARRHRTTQLPALLVLVDGAARFAAAMPADPDAAIEDALR